MSAPITTSLFALAAAAACATMFSASVHAAPVKTVDTGNGRTVRSVEVSYGDLDLTSAQGAATLETRMRAASRLICGSPGARALHAQMDHRACLTETRASTQRAMVTLLARAQANERIQPGARITIGS